MCTRHFLLCPLLLDCRRFFLHPQLISFVLLLARRRITPFREDLCFCSVAGHLIVRCPITAIAFAAPATPSVLQLPGAYQRRRISLRSSTCTTWVCKKSAVSRNRATSPLYIAQNVQLQHVCAPVRRPISVKNHGACLHNHVQQASCAVTHTILHLQLEGLRNV